MLLRCVVFGVAGALSAGAAMAQTPAYGDPRQGAAVQPYIPQDGRNAGAVQAFSPGEFRSAPRPYPAAAPADTRTGWADHRGGGAPNELPQPQYAPPQDYRQSDYRAQDNRTQDGRAAPVDYRAQAQQGYRPPAPTPYAPAAPVDYRTPPTAQPYRAADPRTADPRGQDFRPQDVRNQDQRVQDNRTQDPRAQDPRAQDPRAQGSRQGDARPAQDFRNPVGAARLAPGVMAPGGQNFGAQPVGLDGRYPVYEARPGVIDPRVVVPRRDDYIDYKPIDGRQYDFRPADFKPVDTRTLDYRSQDNKTPDQKVLDPRLKEKGPEIQTVLDCKAIVYRAVECNFIDYREVDPKLQELLNRYPEVAFGVVPKEFSKEAMDRWAPLLTHLSREIGLKISLKVANDYQALMESQRAGLVHVALYSPMAYARARHTGVKIDAFAIETNPDGGKGAHAMLYAMARSGAPRAEDFKAKSIGLVDPNSISGYFAPRHMLALNKIDADAVMGKQVFTGSHENALTALSQGLVDFAVGEWNSEEDSTLSRLIAKGALRHVDGTPMRRDDFRVVMKSELIVNSPLAYLSDMPDDLKALIRRAMLEAPMRDRAGFEKVYDVKGRTWDGVDAKAYDTAVDLVKFMDDSRLRVQAAATRQQAAR